MKNSPLVTIVTPTYNHEEFIAACIDSVLAQTYSNWELCIVDDGSTDRTLEIANSYSDPRIKVTSQFNKGMTRLAETYNFALSMGSGELVAILEGDDFWPPNKLEIQVPDFEDESIVLSSGLCSQVNVQGRHLSDVAQTLPIEAALKNNPVGMAFFYLFHIDFVTFTWPCSTVLRRSTLEKIGGFQQPENLKIVDLPTMARISLEGGFRFHEDRVLGYWRRHPSSATISQLPTQLTAVHHHAAKLLSEFGHRLPFESEIDELDNQWACFQVHRCVVLARLLWTIGRKSDARSSLKHALKFRGGWKRKVKILAGLLSLSLNLSPEPIYNLMRLADWKADLFVSGMDPLVNEAFFEELPEPIDLVAAAKSSA